MNANPSSFAAVGDNVLSYVGSGAAHPDPRYTTPEPKGTMGRGKSPTGTKANRSNKMIGEISGPKCCVTATLYKPNASSASATERNVRIMPSAMGRQDFWKSRNAYQSAV
jgi:hypothetical protein